MDVDVESVLGLHLERGLNTGIREDGGRRITLVSFTVFRNNWANACQWSNVVIILLCIIITRNPVSGMIACHGKLGMLLLDDEIIQTFLLWELIAQAHTIIIYTETDGDVALRSSLVQIYLHLVVMVADGGGLAPYWLPGFIESRCLAASFSKTIHQAGFLHTLRGMFILSQFQS